MRKRGQVVESHAESNSSTLKLAKAELKIVPLNVIITSTQS